jgi:hypothetical protein
MEAPPWRCSDQPGARGLHDVLSEHGSQELATEMCDVWANIDPPARADVVQGLGGTSNAKEAVELDEEYLRFADWFTEGARVAADDSMATDALRDYLIDALARRGTPRGDPGVAGRARSDADRTPLRRGWVGSRLRSRAPACSSRSKSTSP